MWQYNNYSELYHHGILGQKWGKRNGPPYPLDAEKHSASEKKAGWRKSLKNNGGYSTVKEWKKTKKDIVKREKFILDEKKILPEDLRKKMEDASRGLYRKTHARDVLGYMILHPYDGLGGTGLLYTRLRDQNVKPSDFVGYSLAKRRFSKAVEEIGNDYKIVYEPLHYDEFEKDSLVGDYYRVERI